MSKWWIEADGTGKEEPVKVATYQAAAKIITDILMPGIKIQGDCLVLSSTALHKAALAIEAHRKQGAK